MASTQVEVIIRLGPDSIQRCLIHHGEFIIGADRLCDLLVDGDGVSRNHARLTLDGSKFVIEDLGSTNGTFLDGVRLAGPTPVRFGQQLRIGEALLEIAPAVSKENVLPAAVPAGGQVNPAQGLAYKIGREVARGGMGAIREAEHMS